MFSHSIFIKLLLSTLLVGVQCKNWTTTPEPTLSPTTAPWYTTQPPYGTTRRPIGNVCPFHCPYACVYRRLFGPKFVCVLPMLRHCKICCHGFTLCRRLRLPLWACYQNTLDCVAKARQKYRYYSCKSKGSCIGK